MAEEKENTETQEGEEKEEKSSNKLLLIIIIVVLLLIVILGAVAAFLLMGSDEEEKSNTPQTQKVQSTPAPTQQRSYSSATVEASRKLSQIGVLYPLDTFTVNLKSDNGRRYLKVTMDLELSGQELTAELDNKTAVIRDRIIRILTSKTLEEVSSRKGKDKLTQQIKDTLNAMLDDGQILGVYFTEFVIQ
ncbi:Flagellar biosynthesis protein FliL [hydrothermal vent metagenome]|uniref:Flagellar biosynthesis protein FliL n=1 Tax=hydrothermal vent metagenome TaxID=652676 RepID=A0A1W1B9A5_9ZZZZ